MYVYINSDKSVVILMADPFTLAINISLSILAAIATVIFLFTWRKRPDLVYWFIPNIR